MSLLSEIVSRLTSIPRPARPACTTIVDPCQGSCGQRRLGHSWRTDLVRAGESLFEDDKTHESGCAARLGACVNRV